MRNKKTTTGGLGTKLFNTMLAFMLVLGLSPVSMAAALQSNDSSQGAEQAQVVDEDDDADANVDTDNAESPKNDSDSKDAAGAADEQDRSDEASEPEKSDAGEDDQRGEQSRCAEPTTASEPDAESDKDAMSNANASEPAYQAASGIMTASDVSVSDYNPDADPVEVTTDSGTVNASISYDAEGAHPYDDKAITANDELYASISIMFNKDSKPTLAKPNVSYTLPSSISVKSQDSQNLYDSNNQQAGTWSISNNQVILKFSSTWLNAHASEVAAYFKIQFSIADKTTGDGDNTVFTFPGTTQTVTIPGKDGSVSGCKSADNNGAYDAANGTYSWTIKVSPTTAAHNLVVSDTLGSNLTFNSSSVTYTDKNGNAISGASCSASGQNITFNLGDLTAGDYYIKYTTTVNKTAIDALTDNQEISDVDNKCKWSWGTTNPQSSTETTASPTKIKYSMVSKSADGSSTPDKIKWTVTLNNGTLLANMSGYQFSDNAGSNQSFLTAEGVTITGADGSAITPSSQSFTESGLSFTLPSTVGKQKVTVTYYTTMTDTSSKDTVKNTATVTPGTGSEGPEGTGTGSYTPPDDEIGITKTLTSTIDPYNYGGTATWSSVIDFGSMSKSTTASSIKFTDQFSSTPEPWNCVTITPSSVGVTAKTDAGDVVLESGVDYTLATKDAQSRQNDFITIQFNDTDAVKSLIGASGAKVTIVYTTTTTPKDGTYVTGTYTNKSTVVTNNAKSGKSATASFEIKEKTTAPAVQKSVASNATWDASYEWDDGTKGAWIVGWTAKVNQKDGQAVMDLNDQDVTLTDILPANTEVVANSATYKVMEKAGYNGSKDISVTPTVADGKATFTAVTKGAEYSWGGALPTPVSVVFSYKTATKNIEVGTSVTLSNSATAKCGETSFPAGTASTTIDNNVLSKSSSNGTDEAHVKYTIVVNPNALDLVDGDTLVLEDTMSATLSYTAGSLKAVDGNGNDVTSSCSANVSNIKDGKGNENTLLALNVPDATKLTITYECMPLGYISQKVEISNSVKLSGQAKTEQSTSTVWQVAKSTAGADAVSYGLTVTKTDQADSTKLLKGAQFTLYEIDLSTGNKTDTVGTATTDAAGTATFGTIKNPLHASTLYYVEETKAPSGYEISYDGSYVLFYPATATTQAVTDFESAYEAAVNLGHTPVIGTVSDESSTGPGLSYSVYDKKTDSATATLSVHKTVEGATEAMKDKTFSFKLTQTNASGSTSTDVESIDGVKAGESKSFSELTFSEEGTYHYVISETGDLGAGWTKGADVKATVTVTKGDDGLEASVSYDNATDDGTAAQVTNTFETGSATISVYKTVNGGTTAKPGETFTFDLYKAGDDGKATGTALGTVTTEMGKVAKFDSIAFDTEGTYKYVIHETGHNTEGWTAAADVTATVTVTESADGDLVANVSYSSTKEDAALFDNTYQATGSATISVNKTVTGGTTAVAGEEFEFALYKAEGYSVDADGNVTGTQVGQTVKAVAGETKSFAGIDYTFDDAGKTYNYVVHEIGHNTDGWTADTDVNVTVKVTDAGKGALTTEVTYDRATDNKTAAKFTNVYSASGEATISVYKTVNGGTTAKPGETFTFDLYNTDETGKATGDKLSTVTTKMGEVANFDGVKLTAEGTFKYIICETGHNTDGWTAAADVTATVTAKDNGKGKLVTSVEYSNAHKNDDGKADAAAFNNTYEATGSATISIYKTVNGGTTAKPGEKFTFELYKADAEGKQTGDKLGDVETVMGQVASFDNLNYTFADAGKTYKYVIHETGHNTNGWTAADDVIATVKVTDPGKGKLTTSVEYSNAHKDDEGNAVAAAFNDTYAEASGQFQLALKKTVNGSMPKSSEAFEFSATATGDNAADAPAVSSTAKTDAKGEAAFPTVKLSDKDAGKTYTYTIHETTALGTGWTAAPDATVTVTVGTRDADGNLPVTVKYGDSDTATFASFDNKYSADCTATIKVSKTVVGGTSQTKNETFDFQLKDSTGNVIDTATGVKDGGEATFSAEKLGFTTADAGKTFNYVVTEIGHNTDGWTAGADVKVTVTITENEDHSLTAKVIYNNDEEATAAKFTNVYSTSGEATISVYKTVNGGTEAKPGESFTFTLIDQDGKTIGTVSTEMGKIAGFNAVEFTTEGTYKYTIHETGHNEDGWTAAADVIATVTTTDDGMGHLTASVEYSNANADKNAAAFNNTYEATGEATISVYKTVNGGTTAKPGESFTFELIDENGKTVGTVSTEMGKVASFENLNYSFSDAGKTHTYTIHETGHNEDGWTAAADVTATVTVTDAGKGKLATSVEYSNANADKNAAAFNNTYEATGEATISVNKVVNGGTEAAEGETFDFELIDSNGKTLGTVTAKAGETVSFNNLAYNFEDAGKTYTYTIHETGHNTEGWFAASDVTATVAIVDNNNGTLGATVTYSNGTNAAAFDNTKSAVNGKLEIKKTVNGGPAQTDEHFTFELQPQGDAPAAEKATTDTFGGDTCDFGNIEFTKPGTYTYVIHETSELGDGWTNDEDVTVTVTVVRDEENKCLKIESIDYGDRSYEQDGVKMAHFDNKYVAPSTQDEDKTTTTSDKQSTDKTSASTQSNHYGKTGDYLVGILAFASGILVILGGIALAVSRRLRRNK